MEIKDLYKYPRTYHFPFSEGATSDDKILNDIHIFDNKKVVITEKMDGENTSIYNGYFHARSLDSKHNSYHSWLAQFVSIMYDDFSKSVAKFVRKNHVQTTKHWSLSEIEVNKLQ